MKPCDTYNEFQRWGQKKYKRRERLRLDKSYLLNKRWSLDMHFGK